MGKEQPVGAAWCVVLPGGEGARLRSLIRALVGDERPKQFAAVGDVGRACLK